MADEEESLDAQVEAQFRSESVDAPDSTDAEDESDAAGDSSSAPSEEEELETPVLTQDQIEFLGRKLARDQAEALGQFYDWAQENPTYVQAFDAWLRGDYELVPAGQQAQAPAPADSSPQEEVEQEEDLSDLPASVRAKLTQFDAVQAQVERLNQAQAAEQLRVAQTAVAKGKDTYQTRMGLTDEDMVELEGAAVRLGVLPNIAAQTNDMIRAVEETLDLAYWSTPKFREAALAKQAQQNNEALKRQRKANALGSSSGSVPRTASSSNTPQERREAMISELSKALNGGSE